MKFPERFKLIWWIILLIALGVLVVLRRTALVGTNPQSFDVLLLAVAAALLLLPFFSELTLLGLTLKQHVEEAKKEVRQDVKDQINTLRADLQSFVNVSNRASSQVFVNTPPPSDNQLTTLEEQIRPILDEFRRELGLTGQPQSLRSLIPSENTVLAFSSRYQIERELTRIWSSRFQREADRPRSAPVGRMVDDLVRAEVIPPAVGRSIREVHSIGSPAVHGEEPSPEKIAFLSDVVPSLIGTLKAIR